MSTKTTATKKTEERPAPKTKKAAPRPVALKEKQAPIASKRSVVAKKVTKKADVCTCRTVCKSEEAFWIHHGPVVASIEELMSALADMSDEQFAYHTERNGNDFSAWLRDCFGEQTLASRIERASTRAHALQALKMPCCK
ncbi:MAG: hypothetical protein KBD21_05450 [Candidatus Pacebacteria bacterium]|nr:hypothetical protein [Candidatus Paceibacterota bacterium]